ncbi:hypothetical protein NON20_25125 (plasmid) [Synechocystis sp. B12]|nr:hypothetical protein NON20_25125 [Synechocystis sp. B12]
MKLLDGNLIYKYANIFIFGNYQLPESWIIKMPKWAVEFYKSLHRPDNLRLSLPYLYLSILKHFLKMLPVLQTEYHPQLYKVLLGNDLSLPCKIYDPLQIIDSFCETLETLWKNRDIGKLKEFKVFKFTSQGLLQGKQSKSSSSYTTILAYCGGWTDAKGKCGHTPLVIGKHRVCEGCGYLICPEDDCQFCKRNCSHYEKRKEARQRRRRY